MSPSGKWIDGLCTDCSVEDAARRSLEVRLTAVAHWLPLAAYLAEHDIEHVHRLRVSTRRAMAAMKLYCDCLPPKPAHWLKKRLKNVRRAAGAARDLDVLGERLRRDYGDRAAPVLALIATQRADAQSDIVDIAERCRREDRLVRKTSKLLEGIRPAKKPNEEVTLLRDWASEQLAKTATSFFAAAPDDMADVAALHQFRIRGKELRYTIELVATAFAPELRKVHYPIVEELQEFLGKIQDHVTASASLSEWADQDHETARQELLHELAAEESVRLAAATSDFREWWTSQRADRLRVAIGEQVISTPDGTMDSVAYHGSHAVDYQTPSSDERL